MYNDEEILYLKSRAMSNQLHMPPYFGTSALQNNLVDQIERYSRLGMHGESNLIIQRVLYKSP